MGPSTKSHIQETDALVIYRLMFSYYYLSFKNTPYEMKCLAVTLAFSLAAAKQKESNVNFIY